MPSKEFQEGADAFDMKMAIKSNPYSRDSDFVGYLTWIAGWTHAFYEESGKAGRGRE